MNMAEIEYTSLEVTTPSGRRIPNRLLKLPGAVRSLMVIFPGLNYTCDYPLLYYTTRLAVERSADVLQLWADYTGQEFQSLSKVDQVKWLLEDARALIETGRNNRTYERLVLVGKSIGTLTLAALFAQGSEFINTPAIWLTPLFRQPAVLDSALRFQGQSLFICGRADPSCEAGAFKQVQALTTAQTLLVPKADHSLEIPGDMPGSLQVLERVMAACAAFLDEGI